MSREFIHKTPRQHPGGGDRDITEMSKKVEELSRQVSAEERPHLSSRFIDRQHGSTETVDLIAEQVNGVVHGLGRAYRGWHIAGINTAAVVYEPSDAELAEDSATVDKTVHLPLKCSANCTIKLVVW
jgi:hypothetical protein